MDEFDGNDAMSLLDFGLRHVVHGRRSRVSLGGRSGGLHDDLTPTHYGIGSETPNLKPTSFKSKRCRQAGGAGLCALTKSKTALRADMETWG